MKFFQHPEHVAICIAWAIVAALSVVARIAIGPEEWYLVMPLFVFIAAWVTIKALINKPKRLKWDRDNAAQIKAANISQKPTSVHRR